MVPVSAFHLLEDDRSLAQTTPYKAKARDLACFRVSGPICIPHIACQGWLPRGYLSYGLAFPGARGSEVCSRFLNKPQKEESGVESSLLVKAVVTIALDVLLYKFIHLQKRGAILSAE